jgi:hypothetical protein
LKPLVLADVLHPMDRALMNKCTMYNFIGTLHHKNEHGIHLMKKAGADIGVNVKAIGPNDWDIYCSDVLPARTERTLYGPQIDFRVLSQFKEKYPANFLSEWVCRLAKTFTPGINAVALPFPVDIDAFVPESRTGAPVLYFKQVDYSFYKGVYSYFKNKFRNLQVFDYEKKYKESKYMKAVANAPFAIWLGRHESQGFALQECLSAGCPIFVIDIRDMSEEVSRKGKRNWGEPGPFFPATAAPYFDERCGIKCFPEKYKTEFDVFYANLGRYKPRDYVVENLSVKPLLKLWGETLK